ncbi:hypothetical protein [Burkholderia seminalis]|uniref:hypothetical protein n=1 Tax=Burkholderia seminalis TaxID=488731 RepID=UPI0031D5A957
MEHKESAEIAQARWEDHHDFAASAYRAANNHLNVIEAILGKRYDEQDSHELLSRLRSFFWELYGVWDLLHAWANIHYKLGLTGSEISPGKVQKKMKDNPQCAQAYAIVDEAVNSEWFFEVRTYRNYAHRSYMRAESIVALDDNSASTFLVRAREGQGLVPMQEQLKQYLLAMGEVGKKIGAVKAASTGLSPE